MELKAKRKILSKSVCPDQLEKAAKKSWHVAQATF